MGAQASPWGTRPQASASAGTRRASSISKRANASGRQTHSLGLAPKTGSASAARMNEPSVYSARLPLRQRPRSRETSQQHLGCIHNTIYIIYTRPPCAIMTLHLGEFPLNSPNAAHIPRWLRYIRRMHRETGRGPSVAPASAELAKRRPHPEVARSDACIEKERDPSMAAASCMVCATLHKSTENSPECSLNWPSAAQSEVVESVLSWDTAGHLSCLSRT